MITKNSELTRELKDVCERFRIEGDFLGYEEVKLGHINSTYYTYYRCPDGAEKQYVVQKINMYVFKNPRIIMENIDKVSSHIREKNPKAALHFHHTGGGRNYYINKGNFWRLYTYVDADIIEKGSAEGMRAGGKAFGEFQMYLNDFDAECLKEVIPEFHNTKSRFEHLFTSSLDDPCERVQEVRRDLTLTHEISGPACAIYYHNLKNPFPLRPTHNDTKTNNVLIDKNTFEPICVIDLDTVMPGLIMHDFGDAIRYGANTAEEDERDLEKVGIDLEMFRAFAEGFIGATASILTPEEVEYMPYGAISMAAECAVRFLDDYISGDQYFRIDYPDHNLVRSRNQLKLTIDMIAHLEEMSAIVNEVYEKALKESGK